MNSVASPIQSAATAPAAPGRARTLVASDERPVHAKWVGALVGGAVALLASALWAWWLGRRNRTRLARLRRLQDEMRDS